MSITLPSSVSTLPNSGVSKYQFSDSHSALNKADGLPGYYASHPVYEIPKNHISIFFTSLPVRLNAIYPDLQGLSYCILLLGIFNIIQDFRSDSFPRSQNRDSRRITHYKLAAYFAFGFSERKAAFFCIKKLPEDLSLPEDRYIPDPAILIYPSGIACGSPQEHLPAALFPGHDLRSTD